MSATTPPMIDIYASNLLRRTFANKKKKKCASKGTLLSIPLELIPTFKDCGRAKKYVGSNKQTNKQSPVSEIWSKKHDTEAVVCMSALP